MSTSTSYHIPVLLTESIAGLAIKPGGIYVDVTFGGGGHSKEIIEQIKKTDASGSEKGHLYAFDQDEDAEKNLFEDPRFTFVRSNFRHLSNFMAWHEIDEIDGLLADLGVSSHHFDDETRGFSFRFDSNLDMRMNKKATITAAKILNTYTESDLANVFYYYGELRNSRPLARAIIKKRTEEGEITSVNQLMEIFKPFFNRDKEKKQLAQAFQALRIEVNGEMDALKEMLMQSKDILKKGGRLSVITYHSLEDRLVKNFFKTGNFEGTVEKDFFGNVLTPFKMINNKVIVPTGEEIEKNPRSRSAKLRIVEKI